MNDERPEIGTTEAALRSCLSLMAAVTGQSEELIAYWCDLYYQVRQAHENAQPKQEDPTVLRRGDLYPVMRELMRDALRSAKREEAKERLASRAKKDDTSSTASGPPSHQGEGMEDAGEDPSTPLRCAQDDTGREGGVEEILGERIGIHGPVEELGANPRGWTAKKQLIRNRLLTARARSATVAQIAAASGGELTEEEIYTVLRAEKAETSVYKRIEAALDALEK